MLVSRHPDAIELARAFRNYGKPDFALHGLNFRMNEFTAALGIVQTGRLDEIVRWKNDAARTHLDPLYASRLQLPDGMTSGLDKYVVFEPIERSTGKVYDEPCHRLLGRSDQLPVSDWIAENHWCVPLYYRPGWRARVKILVTGGSGFIGSHVVDRLEARGHAPRIFDLVPSPYHAPGTVETVIGDLCRPDDVRRAVAGCDAVLHLGAVADVDLVARDPALTDLVNVRGTQSLLDAVREHDVGRFVFASTVWVYGDASSPALVDEDTPFGLPKHFYTVTKIAGEMYTASYGELYDLEHTILRFGIPYGPRSRPTAVVAAFTDKALRGQPLTIAGDGTQSRRFVYVEDLADGVVASLAPAGRNRVFNLVRDEDVSVRSIARTVRDIVADVPIVHVEGRQGTCARRRSPESGRTASSAGRRPRRSAKAFGVTSTG